MAGSVCAPKFLCPECRIDVLYREDSYTCKLCQRHFPIIYGIPDFRLTSDPYLDLEEERAKAHRIADRANELSFDELLDFYYSITDDVPTELATVYKRSILNGPAHLAAIADDIDQSVKGIILDVGCGPGSMMIALASRGRACIGLDIAMRWLVICRKRLIESNIDLPLICADIADHPLEHTSVSGITAIDVIEHTSKMDATASNFAGLLMPDGHAWVTVSNRYTLGPHASTRLWGVGFLPKRLARALCKAWRGVDSLRHVHLTTPHIVARILRQAGFDRLTIRPKRLASVISSQHPLPERFLIALYRRLSTSRLGSWLLVWIGPVAEIQAIQDGSRARRHGTS